MKITNITCYNISLINGITIKTNDTVTIVNPSGNVLNQIKKLEKDDMVMVEIL